MMENTSILSAIIAACGGSATAVISIILSNAITKAKRNRDIEAMTASKRLEGGWAAYADDMRNWSQYVESELKSCREREADLKAQYQKFQDEIQKLRNELGR